MYLDGYLFLEKVHFLAEVPYNGVVNGIFMPFYVIFQMFAWNRLDTYH